MRPKAEQKLSGESEGGWVPLRVGRPKAGRLRAEAGGRSEDMKKQRARLQAGRLRAEAVGRSELTLNPKP